MSPRAKDILDQRVLALSDRDFLCVRDLVEGTLITGAPGSGKSSCSGKQLAQGLLRIPGMGGLILTAKAEETRNWIRYAKECGREKDLIVFNAESGHCFDPLHYLWMRPGRGAGDLEVIVDFISTLVSFNKKETTSGDNAFWDRGNETVERACIKLLDLAGEAISIASIDRVIKSLPTRPGEHEEAGWQKDSFCAQLISKIRDRQDSLMPEQWSDLEHIVAFCFTKWPAFDERPRSSLEMIWAGLADKFLYSPLKQLFCSGKCTFSPETTIGQGRLVICDFPILEYGPETGSICNVILKLIYQGAWLRRDISTSPNPNFLFQDEFQYFVTRHDNFFQQTCRGSRVAVVCLTQNILNLSEKLGETQPGSKTKSFLGNLGVKIFHQQNDTETCNYASEQIGKAYRYLDNYNASSSGDAHGHSSVGGSRQLVPIVESIEFQRLAKPDSQTPYAQALVYQSGKTFNATKRTPESRGANYLSVLFSRD